MIMSVTTAITVVASHLMQLNKLKIKRTEFGCSFSLTKVLL